MQTINELLDLAKEKAGVSSDRQLALMIGISNATPYRTKGVVPNDRTAILLAKLCDMKPEVVIAICHAAKAETEDEQNVWNHMYKMAMSAAVGGLLVSGGVSALPENANAVESVTVSQSENISTHSMDIM